MWRQHHDQDPDACRACGEIALPAASFCASCGASLRPECFACSREIPREARFCPWCGSYVAAARGPNEPASDLPATEEIPRGERRIATALFADLVEYTTLTEVLDPEEVASAMNRLKHTATRIVEGYGGTLNQFAGDEVMALFGVPRAHDDDPVRAVRAAFALHAAVRDLGDELAPRLRRSLRLHTAINTGLMIIQHRDRRDGVYGVTGDTINTAARLAREATRDEVLAGPDTWRAIRDHFEGESLGPLRLRGKAEPIAAYRVLRPAARRRPSPERDFEGLRGRHAELETLRVAFDVACGGRAQLVAVSGEPGVGKTRLFQEFAASVSPQQLVLRGQCPSFGAVAPYQPFRDVLRDALLPSGGHGPELERAVSRVRALGSGCEAHLPSLLALLSLPVRSSANPAEVVSDRLHEANLLALHALLRALARERSVVLVLEDWHWADPASESALEHLARSLDCERLLVLVNFRSQHEPSWASRALRVDLAPLGVEDTRAIVQRFLGEVSDSILRRIQERTGGNPLFIEELCQSVRDLGVDPGMAPQRVIADLVPDTVAAVVRARIDRLTPAQVHVLKLASVLGEEFPRALLEKLCGTERSIDAALEGLVRAELLQERADSATCRFKHAIVQEVAYAMLLHQRRRSLHAAAGRLIEERAGARVEEQIERLAHHFARSDEREKAVFYLERAGDKAAASGAIVQALGHYREAVAIVDELVSTPGQMKRRIELSQKLASVAIYRPGLGVRAVLERSCLLAQQLGDTRAERRCLYWVGWLDASLGRWRDALAGFERCVELATAEGDRRLLARVDSNIGQALYHMGEFDSAVIHLERSIERRRATPSDPASGPVAAQALAYLALIDAERGHFDLAEKRFDQALELAEISGRLQLEGALRCIRLVAEAFRGSFSACTAAADELASRARRIGSTYMLAMSHSLGGYARYMLGEHSDGVAAMREGVGMLEGAENVLTLSLPQACLAGALSAIGSLDEAESLALRALERSERLLDRMGEPAARRVLFSVAARRAPKGGPEVDAALETAVATARRFGSPREEALTWLRAAELMAEAWSPAWRREVLLDCATRFETLQMPWFRERVEEMLARDPS
ncbi:MAG TPA: AAA family ATPase [Myxococcota bacterium]|nr:AAA family ATPase [Myxococcota bacterium]